MKYDDLVRMVGKQGYFDLASVVQLSGEIRGTIRVQLHRWCKAGKLLPLRRGMYAFPKGFTAMPINPAELANKIYSPSYISTHWALGFYGLIPEKVVTYTSITSRVPRSFENAFGLFKYQNIKREAFFGYRSVDIDQKQIVIAEPEKALLDFWHLKKGKWSKERMVEMRFQEAGLVDRAKLNEYAERCGSPRLLKAASLWCEVVDSEQEGTIEL